MKNFLSSSFLILVGAGAWLLVGNTARLSAKKWDAKFDSILRAKLQSGGIADSDILSSVHELKKDDLGQWTLHRMALKSARPGQEKELTDIFSAAGAEVFARKTEKNSTTLDVKKNNRVYLEIKIPQI